MARYPFPNFAFNSVIVDRIVGWDSARFRRVPETSGVREVWED